MQLCTIGKRELWKLWEAFLSFGGSYMTQINTSAFSAPPLLIDYRFNDETYTANTHTHSHTLPGFHKNKWPRHHLRPSSPSLFEKWTVVPPGITEELGVVTPRTRHRVTVELVQMNQSFSRCLRYIIVTPIS